MSSIGEGIGWFAFWIFLAVVVWVAHQQYLKGHDNPLFEHKTPEEMRIREAVIRKLEREAGIQPPTNGEE